MVVDWLRKNDCNVSKAAREFEVDRKRVREWNQKYEILKSNSVGSKAKRRKIGECGRNPLSTDLDLHVFRYLEEESRGKSGHQQRPYKESLADCTGAWINKLQS